MHVPLGIVASPQYARFVGRWSAIGLGVLASFASVAGCAAFGTANVGGDVDPDAGAFGDARSSADSPSPADVQIGAPAQDPPNPVDFDAGLRDVNVLPSPTKCDSAAECSAPATCDDGECEKLAFVSSIATTGAMGGLTKADGICQVLAVDAGLKGRYLAWLSTATTSPDQRFVKANRAYVRVDGTKIAADFNGLKSLLAPLSVTEKNTPLPGVRVRTATDAVGRYLTNAAVQDCGEFSSATNQVANVFGLSDATGPQWTYQGSYWCSEAQALYCFEQ